MPKKNKARGKKTKSCKQNKQPKIERLTPEQITKVLNILKNAKIEDKVIGFFEGLINGNEWLCDQAEKGLLTIAKLRKLFQIQCTEKPVNRNPHLNKSNTNNTSGSEDKKTKGHGRNSADAYVGAEIIDVLHPELKPGDDCPDEYCDGKLYEMSDPGVFVRVVGKPLATATRYNIQKLRCNLCAKVYQAPFDVATLNRTQILH